MPMPYVVLLVFLGLSFTVAVIAAYWPVVRHKK